MRKETVQLELTVDQKKAREAMSEIQKEISDIKKGFAGLTAGTKEYEAQIKKLEDATRRWAENATIADLQKEFNKLNKEIKQLVPGSQAFIEKSKQLAVVRDRVKEVNTELKGMQQNLNPSFIKNLTNTLSSAFKAGPLAVIALLVEAINLIRSYASAVTGAVSEMNRLRGETQRLTGETGPALEELTAKTKALANTFGKDYADVLKSTNALAKEFGITQAEASELIKKGFLAGADSSGEFLDILKEYPAQLQAVGYSAEESIAIITQQVKDGVFSDKGIDAIKEAGLRLREFTKPAADALDAIGLSSKKIQQELANGTTTVRQVINDVSQRLKELPANSQAAQQAITNIFGGAGEDAGRKFLENLSSAKLGIDGFIDTNNTLVAQQIKQLEIQEKTNEAWGKVGIILQPVINALGIVFGKIKLLVANGFVAVLEFFQYFGDNVAIFRAKVIEGLNAVINTLNKFAAKINQYTGLNLQIGTIALDESSADLAAKLAEKKQANYIARKAQMDADAAQKEIKLTQQTEDTKSKVKVDAAKKAAKEVEQIEKGSIEALRKQIEELQKTIERTAAPEVQVKLLADLSQLQAQLDAAEQQLKDARNKVAGISVTATIEPISAEQQDLFVQQLTLTQEKIAAMQNSFNAQTRANEEQQTKFIEEQAQKRRDAELKSLTDTQNALGSLSGGFSTLADSMGEASEAGRVMRIISLQLAAAEKVAAVAAGIAAIINAAKQPFPASIVAIATTVGAIGSAIATFKQYFSAADNKFAKGGVLPGKGGVPTGASHAQGGIALINNTGAKIGEIEGGEPILSLATYRNNKEIIDQLLYASMFANGRKIFANGGFLPGQTVAAQVVPAASGINSTLFASTQNTLVAQNAQIIALLKAQQSKNLVAVLSPKTFNEVQEQSTRFSKRSKL